LGIERAVLVQPSVYGFDNRRLAAARSELRIDTRLVVMVPPDVTETELDALSGQGAVGVRVIGTLPGGTPLSCLEELGARLHERGWHIQLLINAQLLLELEHRLARIRCDFVIDHVAHIPADQGVAQKPFQALLRLLDAGRASVKISAPYHVSSGSAPYSDAGVLVRELVRRHPEKVLWGTDWPCVNFGGASHEPADLLDAVHHWLPEETDRRRVLVDNPASFYGFDSKRP
jgi:predicted TIM-barrel fold metal-dependent hydrolase